MQDYVISGYSHIYRPPYSLTDGYHDSTIYCVGSRLSSILIMIPLVPAFYKDAMEVAHENSARTIWLIAPDVGLPFVSDYYLTWDGITNQLNKECKIFSKFMVENFSYGQFKADIIRNETDTISFEIRRSEEDVGTVNIELTKKYVSAAAPFACDVILSDTYKKRLFACEMNIQKAEYLNNNRNLYDEIHMSFITGNYGGWTYNKLMRHFPALVSKVVVNQFASNEEFLYAREHGISIGRRFKSDSL